MKKIFSLMSGALFLSALLLGCASLDAPVERTRTDLMKMDQLMEKWVDSLQAEDTEELQSTYWEDAEYTIIQPNGSKKTHKGVDKIIKLQQKLFEENEDYSKLNYPEPTRILPPTSEVPIYTFALDDYGYNETFHLEKREGQWKIVEHTLRILSSPS